jgi:hypothetical protein
VVGRVEMTGGWVYGWLEASQVIVLNLPSSEASHLNIPRFAPLKGGELCGYRVLEKKDFPPSFPRTINRKVKEEPFQAFKVVLKSL